MKIKAIISSNILLLFLWSPLGTAEKDYVVVDSNAPSACDQFGGAVLVEFANSYNVQDNTITGTVAYLCQGEPRASFEHMLKYDPLTEQLIAEVD